MFLPPENYSQDMTRKAHKMSATSYLPEESVIVLINFAGKMSCQIGETRLSFLFLATAYLLVSRLRLMAALRSQRAFNSVRWPLCAVSSMGRCNAILNQGGAGHHNVMGIAGDMISTHGNYYLMILKSSL
jgi:hypothetical protein